MKVFWYLAIGIEKNGINIDGKYIQYVKARLQKEY